MFTHIVSDNDDSPLLETGFGETVKLIDEATPVPLARYDNT